MSKPSYYIASRLENVDQVRKLKAILDKHGWHHTYDWTAHGSVQKCSSAEIARVAELESDGVEDADVLIVLLAGGRGTHVELGMGIMGPKCFSIHILGEAEKDFGTSGTTCAFYHHPAVEQHTSFEALLRALENEEMASDPVWEENMRPEDDK